MESMGMDTTPGGMGYGIPGMGMSMDGMKHMMQMYFHATYKEYILFKQCYTESVGAMVGACIVAIVMAIVFESLKYVQEMFPPISAKVSDIPGIEMNVTEEGNNSQCGATAATTSPIHPTKMHAYRHLALTAVYTFQVFLRYCIMLLAMTFNLWLYLAVGVGAAIGYFLFGWRRLLVTSQKGCDAVDCSVVK